MYATWFHVLYTHHLNFQKNCMRLGALQSLFNNMVRRGESMCYLPRLLKIWIPTIFSLSKTRSLLAFVFAGTAFEMEMMTPCSNVIIRHPVLSVLGYQLNGSLSYFNTLCLWVSHFLVAEHDYTLLTMEYYCSLILVLSLSSSHSYQTLPNLAISFHLSYDKLGQCPEPSEQLSSFDWQNGVATIQDISVIITYRYRTLKYLVDTSQYRKKSYLCKESNLLKSELW